MPIVEQEVWKDIPGYEGLYQASTGGRIKSLQRNCRHSSGIGYRKVREKILCSFIQKNGYVYVTLSKDGKSKTHRLHRIIAMTFLENPYNLAEVNHKDENKQNNSVGNLEWCSNYYNQNYGTHQKRNSESSKIPVLQLDLNGNLIKKWDSADDAGKQLNIYPQNIGKCCKKKIKTAYGCKWEYETRA